ncbi:hypothetical protein EDB92DRAFT_1821873 [Lactarius akahatsu]|uniref:Uncharacterized protein n=1 Tax=Lactarius akahatsu TaxID=416441 RepID=A0AAD4L8G3_9AGAM|nr:hypothetical protein EDB92DRAFT_1821873 [Lactarius akahatsu]
MPTAPSGANPAYPHLLPLCNLIQNVHHLQPELAVGVVAGQLSFYPHILQLVHHPIHAMLVAVSANKGVHVLGSVVGFAALTDLWLSIERVTVHLVAVVHEPQYKGVWSSNHLNEHGLPCDPQ